MAIDCEPVDAHTLALLTPRQPVRIPASTDASMRLVVLGGDALEEKRQMWWNLVSGRRERIMQTSGDWVAQSMGQVPGQTEFVPLPERRFNT